MTLIQRRLNVDATPWRCIDVEPTWLNIVCPLGLVLVCSWGPPKGEVGDGGGGGGGGICSLIPQNQNLNFLRFLLPKITFVPLFPSFLDVFPCFPEINGIIPLVSHNPQVGWGWGGVGLVHYTKSNLYICLIRRKFV